MFSKAFVFSYSRNFVFVVFSLYYFSRYGPVQSVQPLPGKDGKEIGDVGATLSAVTVAFMDIKSACKALQTPHKLEER